VSANSALRRLAKQILYPVVNDRSYKYFQGISKAWDIRTGSWSEPELDLIPFAVRPGETVLDIGANYGVYSYHLSRAVGSSGRVYAFEPVPFTYATLQLVAKILRFRNVELIEKGCSDKSGEVTFAVPVQTSGAIAAGQAYIGGRDDARAGSEQQVRWAGTKSIVCEVVALDEFLPQTSELSFIKCDIEGAELLAFRGAEKLISRFLPSVVCEINPWFLEGFGIRLEQLTGFFFDRGYGLYFYSVENQQRRLRAVEVKDVVEDNYLFIHPQRRSRFAALLS
jgi:FkbM family methyltransferase